MTHPVRAHGSQDQASLEILLRPPRKARVAGAAWLLLCLLQTSLLLAQGAILPAAVVMLGGGAMGWGLWQLLWRGHAVCRAVQLCPDGSVRLLGAAGDKRDAVVEPGSLRLGRHLLLVLRISQRRRVRLLLGPGILSAQELAAINRWLQRAPRRGTDVGVLG